MGIRSAFLSIGLILFPSITMAQPQSPCPNSYISGCLATAIISACGDLTSTSCICGSSGQGAIASLVGPCLLAECPITEILAIGNFATSACDAWLSTNTLTTGTLVNGTGGATPTLTTFTSITTSGPGDMSITNAPITNFPTTNSLIITSLPTNTSTGTITDTITHGLSVGADVGIGVGILAVVATILFLTFCLRRRQTRKAGSPESHELQTDTNISELADKVGLDDVHVVEIPRHELGGFEFPFHKPQMFPVEADSQSVRAQSRGRVTGTETTAFDFESQKVLITPGLRDQSRASSQAPTSSPASTRRYNLDGV